MAAKHIRRPAAKAKKSEFRERVRIRMYRQGLGDCFLLSFRKREEGKYFHMLIDCGVVLGTSEPAVVMKLIAEDIQKTTGGKLDVLVITHEHWDHLSGFDEGQARKVFDDIQVDALWLAWTEDDTDDLALTLREERRRKKEAAQKAQTKLKELEKEGRAAQMTELLGLFGAGATGEASAEDEGGTGTSGALNYLKAKCSPTIVETETSKVLNEVEGLRVYVMGPPKDGAAMRKTNPYKGEGYGLVDTPIGLAEAFAAAFDPEDERAQPFAPNLRRKLSDAGMQAQTTAGGKELPGVIHRYFKSERQWRSIDDAWLATGERMALQLDNATNNTSLVLAFELDGRDVLLFVGDAQAGNWRSWENCRWRVKEKDGSSRSVTAEDLLKRTIFYKVGHHGSHNATMKTKGLEMMKHPRLSACIPVDTEVAHNVKSWKHMPLPKIQEMLGEKCAVIFQSDEGAREIKKAAGHRWKDSVKTFTVNVKNKKAGTVQTSQRSLYTDYFV